MQNDNEQAKEVSREKKTDKEIEEEKKQEEEKQKELADIEIKDGDYTIRVHIIEARDLKAENLDGTSDPYVTVEAFGQKRTTQVIKGVTTCVFDEVFIFSIKDLDKEKFEEGKESSTIHSLLIVTDLSTFIGTFSCRCNSIDLQRLFCAAITWHLSR